jgi:dolichyl-phosphate-mannose-protein mannosyltransferase
MSSPTGVRQRAAKDSKKRSTTPNPPSAEIISEKAANFLEKVKPYKPRQKQPEWDYKIAITIITALAFVTRFWGISHPDQVVFDEVHFGKVRSSKIRLLLVRIGWQSYELERR